MHNSATGDEHVSIYMTVKVAVIVSTRLRKQQHFVLIQGNPMSAQPRVDGLECVRLSS